MDASMPSGSVARAAYRFSLAAVMLLMLGMLAGLAPTASATPQTSYTPTTLSDSGKFSAIDQVGTTIVVAHVVGSARQLVFTKSTDSGATWTDIIPTSAGARAQNIYGVRLRVIDSTHWAAAVWENQEAGNMIATSNGGTSFTTTALAYAVATGSAYQSSPLDIDGGIYSGSYYYVVARSFYCSAACSGNTVALEVWVSSNGGTSWGEVGSPVPDTTTRRVGYVSVDFEDSLSVWTIFYAREVTNEAGDFKLEAQRTTNSGGAYSVLPGASSAIINDPFSPLTAPYGGRVHVDHGEAGAYGTRTAVFECQGGKICVAKSQGNLGPTGGAFYIEPLSSTVETCFYCEYYNVETAGPPGAPYLFAVSWQETVASKFYHYANSTTGSTYTVYTSNTDTNTGFEQNPGVMVDANGCGWVSYNDLGTDKLKLVKFACPTPPAAKYAFSPANYFCAIRGEENFGYNYKEGVTFTTKPPGVVGVDLEDYYKFSGDAGNFDYLGKTLPASPGAKVFFTIEAATEGVDSVFRAGLSFVDHATYDLGAPGHFLNGPDDAGTNAKGNGKDTEVFNRWIEVRFLETGDDWNIAIYYVDGDNDVDERTKLGQSKLADDPNGVSSYVLTVDTVAGYVSVRHADGSPIGNSIADGLNQTLPSTLVGNDVYGQWFVGYGADTAFNDDAETRLNNNDGDAGSTCVYLLREVDGSGVPVEDAPPCIGECGSVGPVLVYNSTTGAAVPEGLTPGSGGGGTGGGGEVSGLTAGGVIAPGTIVPDGWTVAAFNGFLALLLIGGIGGGMWGTFGRHWVALVIGSVLGFILAMLFQLLSLWVLIFVVVVSVAIIFLRVKQAAGGAA